MGVGGKEEEVDLFLDISTVVKGIGHFGSKSIVTLYTKSKNITITVTMLFKL